MTVGTKSVLFGAHCFFLHPWFVARAWWKLYGFPWDPRLWVAFFIHDLGYWGCRDMDGPEGERHPEWAARVMTRLFDRKRGRIVLTRRDYRDEYGNPRMWDVRRLGPWGRFVLFHSRFYAKQSGEKPSRLCIADKLAIALTPAWLYVPMTVATGEIREYTKLASTVRPDRKGNDRDLKAVEDKLPEDGIPWRLYFRWYRELRAYMRRWVEAHRDGREDTWTPEVRETRYETGVWR